MKKIKLKMWVKWEMQKLKMWIKWKNYGIENVDQMKNVIMTIGYKLVSATELLMKLKNRTTALV